MITSRDIAQTLVFAGNKDGVDSTVLVRNTLAYLKKKNMTHLLPEVLRILEQESAKEIERESVVIETPYAISKTTAKEISKELLGDPKGDLEQVMNEDLIGGFVARHGGVIHDASLKRKIELLKKELIK